MIARLYSNENFPQPVVAALRGFGHDVLTSRDAGKANDAIPDEEVLRYATTDQRAVITHNRQDFIHLHRLHPDHHGIITASSFAPWTRISRLSPPASTVTSKR